MSDSKMLSVKPIVHYPRVAQVGKTYLMTIDLQPDENFEWQYEEEEYPIYCTVDSELFSSKPVGEPVIVLHRFGGSYGSTKFLLTAILEKAEGKIQVTLINKWGVQVRVLHLSRIRVESLNLNSEVMENTPKNGKISAIIEQRKPLVSEIERVREKLAELSSGLQQLEEHRLRLMQQVSRQVSSERLNSLSLSKFQDSILHDIEEYKKLRNRFSRTTLNIGIIGRARQGKSRLIQSLTGLTSTEIPDGSQQHCTGVRSTIYHRSDNEAFAEVWFHSERSFLEEIIKPYYQELQLGSSPRTLQAFAGAPLPGLPESISGYAKFGAMYEHLRAYHKNFPRYQHFIDHTSPNRISRDQIREFVAQDTADGKRTLFNYLAVKDVKIFCCFPNEYVGEIALVDMPGLGDTGVGDEERLLRVLSEDVDVVLFVRMPSALGDYWAEVDVRLYDIASMATSLPLSLLSFMILNRTKGDSDKSDNLRNCEALANDISTKHINVIDYIIADCSDSEEAVQKILNVVLDHLNNNIAQIDRQLVSLHQIRLSELQEGISLELNKAKHVLERQISNFSLFEKLFNSSWKKLTVSLDKFSREQKEINPYQNNFELGIEKIIKECRGDSTIPSIEEIETEIDKEGSMQIFYYNFLKQVRIKLSRKFVKLDTILAQLVEQMKNDIVIILVEQGLSSLTEQRDSNFIRELINLLPHESENLRLGFQILLDFNITYSTFLQARIREFLNSAISEKNSLDLQTNQSLSNLTSKEIHGFLTTSLQDIIAGCENILRETLQEPGRFFYATVEEFIDYVIYAEDAQSEWRIFLYEYRYRIWNVFEETRELAKLEQSWQQLIANVEVANAAITELS